SPEQSMSGGRRPERRRGGARRRRRGTGPRRAPQCRQPGRRETMSEFVYLFRSTLDQQRQAMGTAEDAQKSMQAMLDWMRRLEGGGQRKSPGQPREMSGGVVRGQVRTVIDGPYAEATDIVLGFIVGEARDLDHAVELAADCPMVL